MDLDIVGRVFILEMMDDDRAGSEKRRLLIVDAADEGYARSLYESSIIRVRALLTALGWQIRPSPHSHDYPMIEKYVQNYLRI